MELISAQKLKLLRLSPLASVSLQYRYSPPRKPVIICVPLRARVTPSFCAEHRTARGRNWATLQTEPAPALCRDAQQTA